MVTAGSDPQIAQMTQIERRGNECVAEERSGQTCSPSSSAQSAKSADKKDPHLLAYIALGSNIGDRAKNFHAAIDLMNGVEGISVLRVSSFHDTKPVGGPPQPDYLNAVAEVETDLPPTDLLAELQRIERRLGRTRAAHWGPRTIDLDILLMGDTIVDEPHLTIPHPRMHERRFVLEPLCELAPDAVHPRLKKTMRELLSGITGAE